MTARPVAVPPGRAGRLWLEQRLAVARRAADLLDRKLRILAGELGNRRAEAERTAQDWLVSCREAETWLLRAVLLGGERAVRLAAAAGSGEATITWGVTMGARHPVAAGYVTSQPADWEGPAVVAARQAHTEALAAAVRHAAAAAAVRVIEAETAATRARLRAITERWIPRLQQALTDVEFALEEQERADAARLRRAAASAQPTGG